MNRTILIASIGLLACGSGYGATPDEVALRRRLLDAGLSVWEPDPLAAIERAEAITVT